MQRLADIRVYEQFLNIKERFRRENKITNGLLDIIVPLVNIAMLLFMFWLTQAPFIVQPGVKINLPESDFNYGAYYYTSMILTLTGEGLIFFDDKRISFSEIEDVLKQKDKNLIIEADVNISYESLLKVYNLAVKAGVKEIILATR